MNLFIKINLSNKRQASALGKNINSSGSIEDTNERIELLSEAYREVLDATKHQDDKVGRLLTATAFWTAGTTALIALGVNSTSNRTWTFQNESIGSPILFLGVGYFSLLVLASSLLMLTIMTPLRIPTGPLQRNKNSPLSQIFFRSISQAEERSWEENWINSEILSLKDDRKNNYITETFNIAVRANHKFARTCEASSVLQLLLLFLFLIGDASLWAATCPSGLPIPGSPISSPTLQITAIPVYVGSIGASTWIFLTLISRVFSALTLDRISKSAWQIPASFALSLASAGFCVPILQGMDNVFWKDWPVGGVLLWTLSWFGVFIFGVAHLGSKEIPEPGTLIKKELHPGGQDSETRDIVMNNVNKRLIAITHNLILALMVIFTFIGLLATFPSFAIEFGGIRLVYPGLMGRAFGLLTILTVPTFLTLDSFCGAMAEQLGGFLKIRCAELAASEKTRVPTGRSPRRGEGFAHGLSRVVGCSCSVKSEYGNPIKVGTGN